MGGGRGGLSRADIECIGIQGNRVSGVLSPFQCSLAWGGCMGLVAWVWRVWGWSC